MIKNPKRIRGGEATKIQQDENDDEDKRKIVYNENNCMLQQKVEKLSQKKKNQDEIVLKNQLMLIYIHTYIKQHVAILATIVIFLLLLMLPYKHKQLHEYQTK